MISQSFAPLTVILPPAGFATCIAAVLKGNTIPNRMSWSLWALAPLAAFAVELAEHVSLNVAQVTLVLGLGPLAVVLCDQFAPQTRAMLRKLCPAAGPPATTSGTAPVNSRWRLTCFDLACGSLSVVALTLWAVTRKGDMAITFNVLAEALAGVPTIWKSLKAPESESPWTYAASGAASGITVLMLPRWSFVAGGFPGYVALECAIITALIAIPRLRKKTPRCSLSGAKRHAGTVGP